MADSELAKTYRSDTRARSQLGITNRSKDGNTGDRLVPLRADREEHAVFAGSWTAKLAESHVGYCDADKDYRQNDCRSEKQLLDTAP